jgi:hypothetical protein
MTEPTFSWSEFQTGVGTWARHNFGAGPKHHPVLGVIEEVGELGDATAAGDKAEVIDAIGDIVVYMADLCFRWGWSLEELVANASNLTAPRMSLLSIAGKLAHCTLKTEQNIRGGAEVKEPQMRQVLSQLLHHCTEAAFVQRTTLRYAVSKTWAKVSQRDWVKDPVNADKAVS